MRLFNNVPTFPYVGTPFALPISEAQAGAWAVYAVINWAPYFALAQNNTNAGVLVNMQSLGTGRVIPDPWKVRSVYVDNTNSIATVYVQFPDTGYTITVPPGSEAWYPAFTNGRIANVFAEGLIAGAIPTTLVLFTNIFISPFSASELPQVAPLLKSSSIVTVGNVASGKLFDTPAIGDQYGVMLSNYPNGTANHTILNAVPQGGFYIINTLSASVTHVLTALNDTTSLFATLFDPVTTATFDQWQFRFASQSNTDYGNFAWPTVSGMNFKLDATHGLAVQLQGDVHALDGFFRLVYVFTYSPITP